jgi:hypothetical protein
MKTNARTQAAPALSFEEKLQIQESVLRLSYTYGEGDSQGFLALFAEDAALEIAWFDVVSTRLEGRGALAAWIDDLFKLYWTIQCSHVWVGNVLVEGSAEGATTRCLFNRLGIEGNSISTGTWKISHRKIGGQWSIAKLQIFVDGSQEEFAAKQALAAVHAEQSRRSR